MAIQQLLPSLSHELSEALTAIANYLEASTNLMRGRGPTWHEKTQSAIEEAQSQTMRAARVIRRIRELIRPGAPTVGSDS
jgi:two-component system, LuxR family, sensor kinase FixL